VRLRTILARVGWVAALGASSGAPRLAAAQGNLSTQGAGYPEGELSTGALAAGGGLAEFDPLSPINPAALSSLGTTTLHMQYDPEFRTVSVGGVSEHSTTSRFPDFVVALPLSGRLVVGLSAATLLDRTWRTDVTGPITVGDTTIPAVSTFRSTGGITDIRFAAGWRAARWLNLGVAVHGYTGENRILAQLTFQDTTSIKTSTFTQNTTYSYGGNAASVGAVLFPAGVLSLATSYRVGGTLRVRRNDTLQTRGSIPPRVGAGIRYSGITGVVFGVRGDWEGWSRLSSIGFDNLHARDALEIGGGIDLAGPRVGAADQSIVIRAGARERDLPFRAAGAAVHETDFSGGFGIPVGGRRGTLDLALQHAARSAPVGVSESAWTLSVALTVRP
jgi:hypothetical protein